MHSTLETLSPSLSLSASTAVYRSVHISCLRANLLLRSFSAHHIIFFFRFIFDHRGFSLFLLFILLYLFILYLSAVLYLLFHPLELFKLYVVGRIRDREFRIFFCFFFRFRFCLFLFVKCSSYVCSSTTMTKKKKKKRKNHECGNLMSFYFSILLFFFLRSRHF